MLNEENYRFAGVDTVSLAKEFGTPLYVMSEDIIRGKIGIIKESFLDRYPGTRAHYAGKAFLNQRMCKIIASEGIGLDAVSGGEIFTALKAGFDPRDITFHGSNKSEAELKYAFENHIGMIAVDSLAEIDLISGLTTGGQYKANLLIRINPAAVIATHNHINTGQLDCKFGIPLAQVTGAVDKITSHNNLSYAGIHFHLGSQLFGIDAYKDAIRKSVSLMDDIHKELGVDTGILNIGGGYGVDYMNPDNTVPFPEFIGELMSEIESCVSSFGLAMPNVDIEPGRWIVADAGITIYTVGTVKEIPGVRKYASIDGGMPDNLRPSLYGAAYKAVVANKTAAGRASQHVTIAGKCCETGDVLIHDIELPELRKGDNLAVLDTGAYNYSLANNYNMTPRPALVFIRDKEVSLSVRRQTYEDILSLEIAD